MIGNAFVKINNIWHKIDKYIATLASIITISLFIADENIIVRYILCAFILIYLFSIGIYIIKNIINISKAKMELDKDYFIKNSKLSSAMHKYYHNLRNCISSLDTSKILSYKDVVLHCQSICNYLSDFYKALFNNILEDYTISVCIKIIKTESVFDENFNDWTMETIARSTSTDQKRSRVDKNPIRISENSDFKIILSSNYKDELFSFSDMRNIKEDFLQTYKIPYANSRGNDFLDFYRSTIVVPIKIDGGYASKKFKLYNNNIENKDVVLGFLCIDSMKIFETETEKNLFSIGVEYAKSLGDSLYLLFEKILISCLENGTIGKLQDSQHYNQNQSQQKTYNKNKSKNRRRK